jgi:hypothetical protein
MEIYLLARKSSLLIIVREIVHIKNKEINMTYEIAVKYHSEKGRNSDNVCSCFQAF